MPENKEFSVEEDRTIRFLYDELNIKQWAMVAKIMTEDYQMPRNAKQCRDRLLEGVTQVPAISGPLDEG